MSGKELLAGMSFVDDKFIEEAENERFSTYSFTRWTSMAACICILVMALVGYGMREKAENKENAYNQSSSDQIITQAPEMQDVVPEYVTSNNANGEAVTEVPSVILRVESWTGEGFIGSVAELVDTDLFPVGTVLTVQYAEKINVEVCDDTDRAVQDEIEYFQGGIGILVEVRILSFDKESGTVVIEAMTPLE